MKLLCFHNLSIGHIFTDKLQNREKTTDEALNSLVR